MSRRYPIEVKRTARIKPSEPTRVGLFDQLGYWYVVDGERIEFDHEQTELAVLVARAINTAYEDGQQNTRNQMREALGLDWIDT